MTHENQRKPVPPVFAGRVDHGCGCPLGFILGMGCVLLGMRHYGWPPWVALLLFLPAGALSGAIVSLVFDGLGYPIRYVMYRNKLSSFQRSQEKKKRQSGFSPIELPVALVLFGLVAAGLLYIFTNGFPWYYYLFVVVGPILLIFGSLFVMGIIAALFRSED